jgi:hypothetical protein
MFSKGKLKCFLPLGMPVLQSKQLLFPLRTRINYCPSMKSPPKIYYAHSGKSQQDQSDWQTLTDHLHSVAKISQNNARYFGAEQLAQIAGLLHDLGKYSQAF